MTEYHISGKITRLTRLVAAEPIAVATGPAWFDAALGTSSREDGLHLMRAVMAEADLATAARASAISPDLAVDLVTAMTGEVLSLRREIESDLLDDVCKDSGLDL